MKKTAIIFPGQGSQYIGMGQAYVENDPEAAALMEQAEQTSGFPLKRLCFEGPMEDLTRVANLQPALTAVNLICWQQLTKLLPDFSPSFLAGHSLGEYSALHAAGALTAMDTMALVTKRGELMEREGNNNPGGMRAVLGLTIEELDALLADFAGPGIAVVANHNTPAQVVISGDEAGLDKATAICSDKGAKVIPLKVSVANHSPLVAGAVKDFAAFMDDIPFATPKVPVLFNVTASALSEPAEIKKTMARQIASRVRWLEIVNTMVAQQVEVIVELGPQKVLTGMMRKILPRKSGITCMQADTPEAMDKVAATIAG